MEDTYLETFNTRGDLYNEAALICPRAREMERRLLIELLQVEPHHTVCDAPSGGGYLADGLRPLVTTPRQIVCVEPSERFARGIDAAFTAHIAPLHRLPLADAAVNRVGSLAGLHHLADKAPFFGEVSRILAPGGIFAAGDVLDGTPVARFLNGPVNDYTVTGHEGIFLKEGECGTLLAQAGFSRIVERHSCFHWVFRSEEQMVRYCHRLFGMVKATEDQVHDALDCFFDIERTDGAVRLPWSLIYASGVKDGQAPPDLKPPGSGLPGFVRTSGSA